MVENVKHRTFLSFIFLIILSLKGKKGAKFFFKKKEKIEQEDGISSFFQVFPFSHTFPSFDSSLAVENHYGTGIFETKDNDEGFGERNKQMEDNCKTNCKL